MSVKSFNEYPKPWKKYRVFYSGGIFKHDDVEAPNKTWARSFFKGFHQSFHKILSIVEIVTDETKG